MEILVAGAVLATSLVLGNDQYEDPSKYMQSSPGRPAACYSYGGSNMRSGYGSGIVIYHCPAPAKPQQTQQVAKGK